ncbi:MAG: FecR family protein [Bacteroidales bacterium]|nr:FecR family protein [Bacteroidales bacterium]
MNNPGKSKELIKKFKEGNLSPSENRELASIMKAGDQNEDLINEMEEIWAIEENEAETVPTVRIFTNLKKLTSQTDNSEPGQGRTFRVAFIKSLLKYAALILITAGLTWLVRDVMYRRVVIDTRDADRVANNEIFVPYGSKTRIVLPDGSVVTLNSGSYLRYPSTFDSVNRFAFIQGEAFFDIKKDARNPFIVKTTDLTIKVLGTRFNVKSYSDEKTVETTLVSGSIEIYKNGSASVDIKRVLILKPNQQAIYEKQTGDIAISKKVEDANDKALKPIRSFLIQKKVDLDPVIAWKDNRMIFRDESFSELSKKMERWYNVEIEIQNDDLSKALFSGIFEKETVEQALNALTIATPFDYKMNKNKIIIYK